MAFTHINTDMIQFGYNISNEMTTTYQIHCHNIFEVYYFIEGDVGYLGEGQL